ncbi:PITH domain-containing protein [Xylaria scruposa]|nr:PITH domain-containing protein [Xylaria scruposa]
MSHCHDEHAAHGGGHGHDHHDGHDHSDDITPALQHSLYQHIKFDDIVTLNEAQLGSGKAIVKKTWSERLQTTPELASDVDEQILITVPFTGQVKLHSILLRTSPSASAPRTLRVYINRDDLDFEGAESREPTQVFELSQTSEVQEVPVKKTLFRATQRLSLFFVDNFGPRRSDDDGSDSGSEDDAEEEVTRLSYLGFKGEWMALGRAPAQILYEAAANPNDHNLKFAAKNTGSNRLGQ